MTLSTGLANRLTRLERLKEIVSGKNGRSPILCPDIEQLERTLSVLENGELRRPVGSSG